MTSARCILSASLLVIACAAAAGDEAAETRGGRTGKGEPKTARPGVACTTEGGWPDEDYTFRFIRIKHTGKNWDDGMDAGSAAEVNLLKFLDKLTPAKVAKRGEAIELDALSKFPRGKEPSMLYLTGESIRGIDKDDRKALREWCLAGGMLFADAAAMRFHRDFEALMKQVFPDKRLVLVADDDMLLRAPFAFAHGAPPLWHHGGRRVKGVRHKGRWCVVYHPGDVNDAWKTERSGVNAKLAEQAMHRPPSQERAREPPGHAFDAREGPPARRPDD